MDGSRNMPHDGRQMGEYACVSTHCIANSTVMKHSENTNLQKGRL